MKQVNLSKWELIPFAYFFIQDWWDSKLPEESVLCCLSVIPKVLLAGAITLMDEAYFKLAVWLNDRGRFLKPKYRWCYLINNLSFTLHRELPSAVEI